LINRHGTELTVPEEDTFTQAAFVFILSSYHQSDVGFQSLLASLCGPGLIFGWSYYTNKVNHALKSSQLSSIRKMIKKLKY
jgi:hypothetical protein